MRKLLFREPRFGFLHNIKKRQIARFGQVAADAEIHLFRTLVGLEKFVEAENRVVRHGVKVLKNLFE